MAGAGKWMCTEASLCGPMRVAVFVLTNPISSLLSSSTISLIAWPMRGLEIGDRHTHTYTHFKMLVQGSLRERWTKRNRNTALLAQLERAILCKTSVWEGVILYAKFFNFCNRIQIQSPLQNVFKLSKPVFQLYNIYAFPWEEITIEDNVAKCSSAPYPTFL